MLSKHTKALEKENTRNREGREGMIEIGLQTDPDARLLRAHADAAAEKEALEGAQRAWDAERAELAAASARKAEEHETALASAAEEKRGVEAQMEEASEHAARAAEAAAAKLAEEEARSAALRTEIEALQARIAEQDAAAVEARQNAAGNSEAARQAHATALSTLSEAEAKLEAERERCVALEAAKADVTRQLDHAKEELQPQQRQNWTAGAGPGRAGPGRAFACGGAAGHHGLL